MSYRKVSIDELPNTPSPATEKKEVDQAVGIETFGFNVYTVSPGERVPWGYHRHPEHEELFYVLEGTLTVDTPDEQLVVESGEALYVPPEQFNRAHNSGDELVRLVAVGGPKATDGAVIEEECPACGELTGRRGEYVDDGDTVVLSCVDCGEETDRFGR